jgi:peroxiredoxin
MRIAGVLVFLLAITVPALAGGMLAEGDSFPAWTATSQEGKPVSSADYEGRAYLLWFYPKAMTPG